MTVFRLTSILNILCLIYSCDNSKSLDSHVDKVASIFPHNVVRCDTCSCELLIRREESTGSLDFVVDSGTIFLPTKIYTAIVNLYSMDTTLPRPANIKDFLFFPYHDFDKIWPDSTKYIKGYNRHIVTGKVCGLTYSKFIYFDKPVELSFNLESHRPAD
jgi:hypothetical protein